MQISCGGTKGYCSTRAMGPWECYFIRISSLWNFSPCGGIVGLGVSFLVGAGDMVFAVVYLLIA